METSKQTGHKRGASESLNGGDPPSETEQRATRSAIRSRRNSAELHASGTVQETSSRVAPLTGIVPHRQSPALPLPGALVVGLNVFIFS